MSKLIKQKWFCWIKMYFYDKRWLEKTQICRSITLRRMVFNNNQIVGYLNNNKNP